MIRRPRRIAEIFLAFSVLAVCALLWPAYRLLNPHLVAYQSTLKLLEEANVEDAARRATDTAAALAKHPDLLQNLGAKFIEAKRNDCALIFYQAAWRAEPQNLDALRTTVSLLWGEKSAKEALAFLQSNFRPDVRNDDSLLLLEARLLVAEEQPSKALALLPPETADTRTGREIRARAYAAMQRDQEAAALWRSLLRDEPENETYRLELARCLAFSAMRDARQILAVNQNQASTLSEP